MYYSHKEYGHERGLSCCFRQHRAIHSHCSLLHGYALSVRFDFMATTLDQRNWVVDFGGMKEVESFLKRTLDHKLVIAEDDPHLATLAALGGSLADVVILPAVGCEAFAEYIFKWTRDWLLATHGADVFLFKVTVKEHGANGASYG